MFYFDLIVSGVLNFYLYSFERQRDRNSSHPLVHSPSAHNGKEWARRKPGMRKSIQVPHVSGEGPTTCAIICCFPWHMLVRNWNPKQIRDLNPSTPVCNVDIPTDILACCAKYSGLELFSKFFWLSWPMYRHTIDFYILIFYPMTMQNSFIILICVCVCMHMYLFLKIFCIQAHITCK